MFVTKVVFHRLHKFVENGAAFSPAQIGAASYKVLIGTPLLPASVFSVPASLLAATPPTAPVTVPFSAIGFKPTPGTEYRVQVVCEIDGIESPASPAVAFTNSLTPAAPDTVSVA